MLLKKLENNDNGHSALNWVTVLLILMVLSCAILDIINLATLKSTIDNIGSEITNRCTIQSGFHSSVPGDWKTLYDTNKQYWTSGTCVTTLSRALNKTNGQNPKIYIIKGGSKVEVVAGRDCRIGYQESVKVETSCTYKLSYLNAFGLIQKEFTCKTTSPACGFWIHKNTQI